MDDAENGCIRTDTERDGGHGHRSKPGGSSHGPQASSDVVNDVGHGDSELAVSTYYGGGRETFRKVDQRSAVPTSLLHLERGEVPGAEKDDSRRLEEHRARVRYSATGHPSLERLMAEQRTGPVTDVSLLHGDFCPKEESVEDFLEALHEWRGHRRTDPAA